MWRQEAIVGKAIKVSGWLREISGVNPQAR